MQFLPHVLRRLRQLRQLWELLVEGAHVKKVLRSTNPSATPATGQAGQNSQTPSLLLRAARGHTNTRGVQRVQTRSSRHPLAQARACVPLSEGGERTAQHKGRNMLIGIPRHLSNACGLQLFEKRCSLTRRGADSLCTASAQPLHSLCTASAQRTACPQRMQGRPDWSCRVQLCCQSPHQ